MVFKNVSFLQTMVYNIHDNTMEYSYTFLWFKISLTKQNIFLVKETKT